MMRPYPFFPFSPFMRPHPYSSHYYSLHNANMHPNSNYFTKQKTENTIASSEKINENKQYSEKTASIQEAYDEYFEIFGLKLYFDDLLLIALLFFLYQEEVKDTYLYIALLLLLLS